MSIQKLAQEVDRRQKTKIDFIGHTKLMDVVERGDIGLGMKFEAGQVRTLPLTDHAWSQVAERLSIPKLYFERIKQDEPELLAHTVNHFFHKHSELRLVRALDGKARAFLSNRYRPMDDFDLLQAVLPILDKHHVEFLRNDYTETRLYMKVLFPELQFEMGVHKLHAGVLITNSEVGAGAYRVEPFTYDHYCKNGMVHTTSFQKYHVGKGRGGDDESAIQEILSDATKRADDKALVMKVQDVLRHGLLPDSFQKSIKQFEWANKTEIQNHVDEAVEEVTHHFGYTDEVGRSILDRLIKGREFTQFGLTSAITRTAQDARSYDEQVRMERDGAILVSMNGADFKNIITVN